MIHREPRGNVTVLRIEHGKANAVDTELFDELNLALEELGTPATGAVILTGTGSFFSAGVDLFRVLEGGRSYLEEFLPALTRGLEALFSFPRPLVAAINGHAVAGGAIVACACDARLMARGRGRIGVPELAVGVPFPVLALEVLRAAVGGESLQELIYGGRTYPPEEALERGLIDEVVDPERLFERALEVAQGYAAIPAGSFRLTKRLLRRPILERFQAYAPEIDPQVLEVWASPATADTIRAYLERTVGKGKR